ncbi:DUF2188 domain-containing protein [Aureibacillus halotolerans]|uniref:Uncharacterized protein DUF2188 n=1 Tax=Aureibacillus halotolerans TaxID=1508390 RepID=A0A4R6U2N3_9BACI|nr:DUF2188 domain-containing protein [Aureibacillus halotolerans]TDQ38635.1 uncharacterized protein DUF2188 [Aureibacillus halotolerans]
MRTKYFVTFDSEAKQWKVKKTGAEKASGLYNLKTEAIDAAVTFAKNNQPSQVIIKNKDGKIEDERTYGNDPYPPKG